MTQPTEETNTEFETHNISTGAAIFLIALTVYWTFGIVLSTGWLEKLISIVFPPYAFLVTSEWFINIINHLVGM